MNIHLLKIGCRNTDYHCHLKFTSNYHAYSENDIENFRKKLNLMKTTNFSDQWEGFYNHDFPDEVGISQLRINFNVGFTDFYYYSCLPELRSLDYGKIINSAESIQLISEVGKDSPRKPYTIKYVKVKWDDKDYLVEESALPYFAEKAVGIYVEPKADVTESPQKWDNYWVKGDIEKPLVGVPQFPASCKKFERAPIESKIIVVGKRTVEEKSFENISQNSYYAESAWYSVTIDAGKNKGVKAGMIFDVPKINSAIIITQASAKTAKGFIRRDIDDNKKDYCVDDNFNQIPCLKIKPFNKVKTQVGNFWNNFF